MFELFPNKLRSAMELPLREKVWLAFLYPYSGVVRAFALIFPFRLYSRVLGLHYQNHQLSAIATENQLLLAKRIGKIVNLTARYTLWEAKCLVQATMARTLLGYYNIPYVMHLGASLKAEESVPLKAHAWVKVGPCVIVGGGGHQAFGIVGTFVPACIVNRA
jgi:hypothetical protein